MSVLTSTYAQYPSDSKKIRQLKNQLDTARATAKVEILNAICDEYEHTFIDSSFSYAQRALALSQDLSYADGIITSSNNVGNYYHEKGEFDKAREYYNKALALAKQTNSKKQQAYCLSFIGRLHAALTDYPTTIEMYLQSITLREELGDSSSLGMINGNLGYVYQEINDLDNAEKHLSKALEINIALQDTGYMITDYINLGVLYHNKDDLTSAMEVNQRGLNHAEAFGDFEGKAIILGNMASVISDMGDYNKAITYLERSLKIKEEIIKKPRSIAHAYAKYQKINLQHNHYHSSIDYGLTTMKLLAEHSNKNLERKVLYRLSEAYAHVQKDKEAYAYLRQYLHLNDSIFNVEKSQQIKRLQMIFDSNKKDMTILQQDGDLKLLAAANNFKTKLIWIGGFGLLLIFGSGFLYRSYAFAVKAKRLEEDYAHRLLSSYEEERKRISRELHDSVGQSLIFIKNKVALNQDDSTVLMVSKALEEVRTISKALHPVVLEKMGLTVSIHRLVQDVDESTDIFFTKEIDPIDGVFSKDHELQIYRIVQESLNNMIKHAKTDAALIRIEDKSGQVILVIKDYGVGFDMNENSDPPHSLGMKTLKERTQILGGKISIESTKNKGTCITLELKKGAMSISDVAT